jgi:hypothetical protein
MNETTYKLLFTLLGNIYSNILRGTIVSAVEKTDNPIDDAIVNLLDYLLIPTKTE